jgi:hypothetical protein
MDTLEANFSLAKIAYSAVLVAVIWFFVQELRRVWFDDQTYLTVASYFVDGKADTARATAFGGHVLAQHHRLAYDLRAEEKVAHNKANDKVADLVDMLPLKVSKIGGIALPASPQKLEMKIQGFDVGGLLEKLRSWVSPVDELETMVEARGTGASGGWTEAAVSWPMAPAWGEGSMAPLRYFTTSRSANDEEAAAEIAGTLLWAALGSKEPAIRPIPRDEFVSWLLAWRRYREVRDLKVPPPKLSDANKALLVMAGTQIKPYLERTPRFAEFWRLAANLVALHPDSIPGVPRTWEYFAREYEIALNLRPATDRLMESAQAPPLSDGLAPGSVVWRADGRYAVKVTAVVKDQAGTTYLLLPAMLAQGTELPLLLYDRARPGQSGQPIARGLRYLQETGNVMPRRMLLAELLPGATVDTRAKLKLVDTPVLGSQLRVRGQESSGTIKALDVDAGGLGNGLIEVKPRITSPGDAGAPILDQNNGLVAMAYVGTHQSSLLLPLGPTLKANKLMLLD